MTDPRVSTAGLDIADADKVLVLLKALPQGCRQWVVLNSPTELFEDYVTVSTRYDAQQRVWSENGKINALNRKGKKGGKDGKGKDSESKGKGRDKSAGRENKNKPGSGKGPDAESRTCFTCNRRGRLSKDCLQRSEQSLERKAQERTNLRKGKASRKARERRN